MRFSNSFVDATAKELFSLLVKADRRKPFAAVLYAVQQAGSVVTGGRKLASAINTEYQDRNPNAHAEINVIDMAAEVLFKDLQLPIEKRRKFCLFVSTRPCPKCTAAIVDAQIFNVYFFYDNNYKKKVAEAIVEAKEAPRTFAFQELNSRWKNEFCSISRGVFPATRDEYHGRTLLNA